MFKAKLIVTIEDATTIAWQIQSFGYDTEQQAKMAAAKVFLVKPGVMVKPHKGQWAIFYRENF